MASVIASLVDNKRVVIFSKNTCAMSHSIKLLIQSFGTNPTVYELDEMPNGGQIERVLLELGCEPSVPAVFIGQQFIGGAPQVFSLNVQNRLASMLLRAGAIFIWNNTS